MVVSQEQLWAVATSKRIYRPSFEIGLRRPRGATCTQFPLCRAGVQARGYLKERLHGAPVGVVLAHGLDRPWLLPGA